MIIVRMISGSSLSAFSASIAQTRAGQTASMQGASPVFGGAPSGLSPQTFMAPKTGQVLQDSTRPPPRGSLLDLSV